MEEVTPVIKHIEQRLSGKVSDTEPHIKFATQILGLRNSVDGLYESIERLSVLLDDVDFLSRKLPTQTVSVLVDFQHVHNRLEAKSSSRNKNNVFFGRYADNEILACLTQRIAIDSVEQTYVVKCLMSLLVIWRCQNPCFVPTVSRSTPQSINALCAKIRKLCVEKQRDIDWPPEGTDVNQILELLHSGHGPIQTLFSNVKPAFITLKNAFNEALNQRDSYYLNCPPNKEQIPRNRVSDARFTIDDGISDTNDFNSYVRAYEKKQDDESQVETIFSEDPSLSDSDFTFEERISRLSSTQYRCAMDNQYLPLDWVRNNPLETKRIIDAILNSKDSELKLASLLTIVTSMEVEAVFAASVNTEDAELCQILCLNTDERTWSSPFPALPGRYLINQSSEKLLAPNSLKRTAPLPEVIIKLLKKYSLGMLGPQLGFRSAHHLEQALSKFCTNISRIASARCSPLKLRSMLFTNLIRKTSDEILSSCVINSDEFSPSSAFYYCSFDETLLNNLYQETLSELGFDIDLPPTLQSLQRFGSQAYWPENQHNEIISNHIQRLEESASNGLETLDIFAFHNEYVAYVSWMLLCATGHRECKAISINRCNINSSWCVFNDKGNEQQNRLVKLSPLIREQLEEYREHLKRLSKVIAEKDTKLSRKVFALSDYPNANFDGLPLFFELEVTPHLAAKPLGTKFLWNTIKLPQSLPKNIQRHWFVTALRRYKIASETILAAAGHDAVGQHIWSHSNVFNIDQLHDNWDEGVDAWLKELGFEKVNTPLLAVSKSYHSATQKLTDKDVIEERNTHTTDTKKQNVVSIIRRELISCPETDFPQTRKSQLDWLRALILENNWSSLESVEAQNALVHFILEHKKDNVTSVLELVTVPHDDSVSLRLNHLVWVSRAEHLREHVLQSIPRDLSQLPPAELSAYVVLNMCLFNGVINLQDLQSVHSNLKASMRISKFEHWIQWESNSGLLHRRLIDAGTMLLAKHAVKAAPATWHEAQKSANAILLRAMTGLTLFSTELKKSPLVTMCFSMHCWAYHYLPGAIAGYATGNVKSTCLNETNFLRLITNQHFSAGDTQLDLNSSSTRWLQQSATPQLKRLRNMRRELRTILLQTQKPVHRSNNQATLKRSRKQLSQEARTLQEKWKSQSESVLLIILADYTAQLLLSKAHGTSKYLEPRSLLSYFDKSSLPLLEITWKDNWLELDEEELSDVYLNALIGPTEKGKDHSRAYCLRRFHDFCTSEYGQEPVDLESLHLAFRKGRKSSVGIRASVITAAEYNQAKQIIESSQSLSLYDKQLLLLLLCLVFRFALRVSEALSLDSSDFEILQDGFIIYVRANRLGRPKTRAGFRQVHMTNLATDDRDLLLKRLSSLKQQYQGDLAALFSSNQGPWTLVSIARIKFLLLRVLKLATGNPHTVIHDTRHTFATLALLKTVANDCRSVEFGDGSEKRLSHNWLGTESYSKRFAYALANQIGHTTPTTTFHSYVHCFDLLLADKLAPCLPRYSAAKLAAWADIDSSTVRQTKSRAVTTRDFETKIVFKSLAQDGFAVAQPIPFQPVASLDIDQAIEQNQFSLMYLEYLCSQIAGGCDIDWLSRHTFLETDIANQMVVNFHSLRKELRISSDKFIVREFDGRNQQKTKRGSLLNKLEQNYDASVKLADIWKQYYTTKILGLMIGEPSLRDTFIDLCESTGSLSVEQRFDSKSKRTGLQSASLKGKQYRSTMMHKHARIAAPQLFIHIQDPAINDETRLMKPFHRAMFLLNLKEIMKKTSGP